jgi:hypothetical protein
MNVEVIVCLVQILSRLHLSPLLCLSDISLLKSINVVLYNMEALYLDLVYYNLTVACCQFGALQKTVSAGKR